MRKSDFGLIVIFIVSSTPLWSSGHPDDQAISGSEESIKELTVRTETHSEFTAVLAQSLRENMSPLFEEDLRVLPSTDEMVFLKHYSADSFPGTTHLGNFFSGEKKLAAYLFLPDTADVKGTVYLFHGYLDHTLSNRYLIGFLLEHNYAVLGFDLPGHGLSEGEPAAIDDFREYSAALARFMKLSKRMRNTEILPGPYTAVAHSTGCSVIMEAVSLYGKMFDNTIMVSPLVHSVGWRFTSLGISLAEPFTDSVFRRFGGSSSNKEHEHFVQHEDPLQSRSVPFSWIHAHDDWFQRMQILPVNQDMKLSVIQGGKDSVVDYEFNIPFLLEKYPNAAIYRFPEGEHSLLNEVPEIRSPVFEQILMCLENGGIP